uniref:Uncharacterized protein n=1 Tax=viral metagenome TaxID=1070528 RepID=A0A6H1ZH17_9ZZZZ
MKYEANIIGSLWTGGTASYQAPIEASDTALALEQAYKWGDFSKVDDVQLFQRDECPTCKVYRWQLVRDWEAGEESELVFADTLG